jgi:putative holliday junction resolvase
MDQKSIALDKRILGIDYGTKRIGIAISDTNGEYALPLVVIPNTPGLVEAIQKLAKESNVNEIVMGESKNYKGEANTIWAESLEFKKKLEDAGFIVHLEPEFMTSMQAARFQGETPLIDASAAALILQSFLDKRKHIKL